MIKTLQLQFVHLLFSACDIKDIVKRMIGLSIEKVQLNKRSSALN